MTYTTTINLNRFVEQHNSWEALFKQPPLRIGRDNQKIADAIDSALSPENLTCDGEATNVYVRQRWEHLTAAARELQQLDPTVKFYEYAE